MNEIFENWLKTEQVKLGQRRLFHIGYFDEIEQLVERFEIANEYCDSYSAEQGMQSLVSNKKRYEDALRRDKEKGLPVCYETLGKLRAVNKAIDKLKYAIMVESKK